ncbi:MAG: DUF3783 domain-containing protein [Schwartzia sp.]|nr:DUF3783 domain-containing protein [Schwartzia sp. (in: firmicutes)]
MKKAAEKVLCYRFGDEEKLEKLRGVMKKLGVECRVLPDDSWREKVGFLLGMGGYQPAPKEDGTNSAGFDFPDEVMILHHIKGKRLDQVLAAMKAADVPPIRYKAVVTPFNTLWTLRHLCEMMKKEHAYMAEGAKNDGGKA